MTDDFLKHIESNEPSLTELTSDHKRIRLISTIPKSGTWFQKYFWSVLDSLLAEDNSYNPYADVYEPKSLNCDALGVGHSFCPGWRKHLSESLRTHLSDHIFPGTRGIDWFQSFFDNLGPVVDPISAADTKVVLVYRNPLDQIFSYFRPRWSAKYISEKNLQWPTVPMPGMLQEENQFFRFFETPAATLRGGAANSYCIQLATFFHMRQLAPDNIALIRYEDIINNKYDTLLFIAKFFDFYQDTEQFNQSFTKAIQLTAKERMSALETQLGHGINLKTSENNGWKDNVHIRSGAESEWREVFDDEDVAFIRERLAFFNIPVHLVFPD